MVVRLVAVLAIAALVDVSGFADAGDAWFRARYYSVRGQRSSNQSVVLVGLDAPATPDKLATLVSRIQRGKPTAIGAVDDAGRLSTTAKLPAGVIGGRSELAFEGASAERAALTTTAGPTVIAQLATAGSLSVPGSEVPINYVGERGLPVVSAAQVANGEIPTEVFAGKLVVIGLTADAYGVVPTPIGPLAPAKVQAHALATIADRAALPSVPVWLRWLAIVVACASAMLIARSIATLGATLANTAIVVGVIALDYILFASSLGWLGATLPVVALFAASSIERIHERIALRRHVRELGYWARQWMALDSMRGEVADDDPGYWNRVDTLAKLYLGCTSTILAELPAGSMRLKTLVLGDSDVGIAERRLDVRRSPYRKPHLTLAPVWHDKFVFGNTPSLLVPLQVRGKLVGFWIVNFENREQVEGPHLALIKTLAQEIATAIDRRRMRIEASRDMMLIAAGRMSLELGDIRRAYRSRIQTQRDLLALGDSLPFGVFVSTLWGEIRYMNTSMKLVCQQEGVDPATASSGLPDILSRLTGFKPTEVHEHLRSLVQELEELHVRGRDRLDRPGRDFVLSWLQPAEGDTEGEQMILVCALPQRAHERRPADDHSATVPVMKIDADGAAQTSVRMLARGTPTFTNGVPSLPLALPLPANLAVGSVQKPIIPDATLHLRKGATAAGVIGGINPHPAGEDFYDEITMIAAGNGRAQRTLPVIKPKNELTMPMFKVGREEQ